jgi:hypothetical protein
MDEKDKRKEMPRRDSWMHKRWYAIVVCGLFFICGLITIFDVPALTQSGVVKPVYHPAIGFTGLLLGLPVTVVFFLLHLALDSAFFDGDSLYLIPSLTDRLLDVVVLCAMTVILFLLVRRLQRFRRVFKWAVYLNYAALMLLLIQQNFAPPGVYYLMAIDRSIACEFFVSDATGIHAYNELQGGLPEASDVSVNSEMITYSITHDRGETWHEFMLATADAGDTCHEATLTNVGKFNDQFFWVSQGKSAAFTHDGGSTWTLWQGYRQRAFWEADCLIIEISFTDEQHGTITCNYIETIGFLKSTDGGQTWHEGKP